MSELIIGIWQGKCHDGDLDANIKRAGEVIDEAAAARCDFVCLPETYLPGYGTAEIIAANAMPLDDARLLARSHEVPDRQSIDDGTHAER